MVGNLHVSFFVNPQGDWPDHRRVRPSLNIHFHSCKLTAGVAARWLSGSVRVSMYLARRVVTIGRTYVENVCEFIAFSIPNRW